MLVSAIHQHESAIGVHISLPSWISLPPPTPHHSSRLSQGTRLSSRNQTANSHCKPHILIVKVLVTHLCLTLWDPMDYRPLGSSVHGILQAKILEWVSISFSRGSSQLRDRTWVCCMAGRFFTIWATKEAHTPLKAHFEILSLIKSSQTLWTPTSTSVLNVSPYHTALNGLVSLCSLF